MTRYSERSDPRVKPRFPRLQLEARRRRDDERFRDDEYQDQVLILRR